jgi:ketosteroid isomerase-like protein
MTLKQADAGFASQPGQLAKGPSGIRESWRGFVDLKDKMDIKVIRTLQASDFALVISEWSFNGTGPDGKPVNIAGKATDIIRQQSDGTWRILIDNPWGTDISNGI